MEILSINQQHYHLNRYYHRHGGNLSIYYNFIMHQAQKKQPLTHTKNLGNVEFAGYLKSQVETVQTIFSLQKYLEKYPAFYYNSLLIELKGRPIQTVKVRLEQQLNAVMNNFSFWHKINAAIESRRKCINKIKRDLTKVSKFLNLFPKEYIGTSPEDEAYLDWVQVEGYTTVQIDQSIQHSIKMLSSIFVDMYRLRDMTIYIVETVHEWRAKLEQHADRCHQYSEIRYYFEEKQLYGILSKDTNFIWSSKLSQYVLLQVKQDPFLIRNVINVQQKQSKTLLQKYFVEMLYPKEDSIVDKSLKCFEMMLHKYQPKLQNLFQEEEMLIQSYLKMEMENNMFDQQKSSLKTAQQDNNYMHESPFQEENANSPKKTEANRRGWVFLRTNRINAKDRINQIVESHNKHLNIIKPYKIANYAQKNSIALAYISKGKDQQSSDNLFRKRVVSARGEAVKKTSSDQQEYHRSRQFQSEREMQSDSELRKNTSELKIKNMAKFNQIIFEDPKQHLPETPKMKNRQQSLQMMKGSFVKKIQFNTIGIEQRKIKDDDKIEVQQQQKPLNIKQFYEVFRADTNKPKRLKESQILAKKIDIKQFIEKTRRQRFKSLPYAKKPIISLSLKKKKDIQSSRAKSIQKKSNSYVDYTPVNNDSKRNITDQKQKMTDLPNQFINMKPKSLPIDLIRAYVTHIFSQQHTTSQYFTNYNSNQIILKLMDPYLHCIIFDLSTQQQRNLGQVILSENVGGREGKLKYRIQFLNLHAFELIITSVLRVSEELLSVTPCEEVICPFKIDKLDIVSTHFIELLEKGFNNGVSKFGKYTILQKKVSSTPQKDIYERLYIFTSETCLKRQNDFSAKMMGNYRALKIQCRCLVLSSNFRLRSKTLFKNTLNKYNSVGIGELYSRLFGQIMTKYHIKQMKQASYSLNENDQLGLMLKNDLFLRNIIQSLIIDLQNWQDRYSNSLLLLTGFNTMVDLLNYLHYKKHDYYFHFQFLEQSRFILNHQLILVQFDQQLSLEFTLTSNQEIFILNNNKQLSITMLKSSSIDSQAYLIPTNNDKIKIFIMSASQFEQFGQQKLDIYSYLCYYFKTITLQTELNEVSAFIMPNLKKRNSKLNKVRMYDGFFRLFPEKQFYSAAFLNFINHWESYYPTAVIHLPNQSSLIFQFPFFFGFYDVRTKSLLTAFLYSKESSSSP